MDNLTHSLTGVLAGRVLPDDPADPAGAPGPNARPRTGRAVFWTLLLAANVPDIDIVANLFVDPLTSLHWHRGFTHSIVAAPLVALLPAFAGWLFFIRGGFARLWLYAIVGVLVHIFFDLITPYGTQIFFPFSNARHSLDWMFIIDPWFTGGLVLLLIAGKVFGRRRRAIGAATLALVVLYVGAEAWLRSEALAIFREELGKSGRVATGVSTLPQPLSVLKWVGLANTDSGVVRQYIELGGNRTVSEPEFFPHSADEAAVRAAATEHAGEYLRFARFPVMTSGVEGDFSTVEFRDLQFSVDPRIAAAVGLGERDVPFVLRMEFDRSGKLIAVVFNDEPVPLRR